MTKNQKAEFHRVCISMFSEWDEVGEHVDKINKRFDLVGSRRWTRAAFMRGLVREFASELTAKIMKAKGESKW